LSIFKYKGISIPQDLSLVASVLFLIPFYTIQLKRFSLYELIAAENKRKTNPNFTVQTEAEITAYLYKSYRLATYLLKKLWRSEKPCLRRSLILYRHSLQFGLSPKLVVGISKRNGELESHAWLEIDGKPYFENIDYLQGYTPILES